MFACESAFSIISALDLVIAQAQVPGVVVEFHTQPSGPLPVIWYVFAAMFGACVGSFLNVVIYRLPEGRSVVHPPSSCPRCGHRLAWYDNVPVLGWMWLRGKCRYCKTPVSVQYPVIEAITAAFFVLTLYFCFDGDCRPAFSDLGLAATWIPVVMLLALVAGLIAATKIDAQFFIIPLEIPWVVTVLALAAAPLAAAWDARALEVLPRLTTWQVGSAGGGLAGLVVAVILLHRGVLPRSFADEEAGAVNPPKAGEGQSNRGKVTEPPPDARPHLRGKLIWIGGLALACLVAAQFGGVGLLVAVSLLWWAGLPPDLGAYGPSAMEMESPDEWLAYPHPRREALKEALFLVLPLSGVVLGGLIAMTPSIHVRLASLPAPAEAFAGALFGYLAAAGLYWAVRVVFTLAFGKEAMGLGDVHLMAAVGAVTGWFDAVLALFVACFFALIVVAVEMIAGRLTKKVSQPIPFGPHLAGATVVIVFFHDCIYAGLSSDVYPILPILRQVGIIP